MISAQYGSDKVGDSFADNKYGTMTQLKINHWALVSRICSTTGGKETCHGGGGGTETVIDTSDLCINRVTVEYGSFDSVDSLTFHGFKRSNPSHHYQSP